MTPQEIVTEIQKLPPAQKKEIIDSISDDLPNQNVQVTEEEFLQILLADGIISEIPPRVFDEEEENFEPIEIEGEPLSETIIRERR